MQEALTLEQLEKLSQEGGIHIWVQMFHTYFRGNPLKRRTYATVAAAITDHVYGLGLVAVWGAGSDETWLLEKDYGSKWLAYLEKPSLSVPIELMLKGTKK